MTVTIAKTTAESCADIGMASFEMRVVAVTVVKVCRHMLGVSSFTFGSGMLPKLSALTILSIAMTATRSLILASALLLPR